MRVAIVMGSVSDLSKVEPAILILKEFGVQTDVRCLSAHRAHHELMTFINECNHNGTEAILAYGMLQTLKEQGFICSNSLEENSAFLRWHLRGTPPS